MKNGRGTTTGADKEGDKSKKLVTAAKQRRQSRPKVKTGCNNCKLRRVKCGEERPQCRNCVRSGRHCDGYPAYRRTAQAPIPIAIREEPRRVALTRSTTPPASLDGSPPQSRPMFPRKQRGTPKKKQNELAKREPAVTYAMPGPNTYRPGGYAFNAQEGQYFQVFRTHTASELSGFFNSEFWTMSVLQESHSEAAIRHAVIALGALYKTLEKVSESPPSSPSNNVYDTAPDHYQFALQQYAMAITRMREALETQEKRSHRTILISIVLFTCFQSFTGDHKAAITQIQMGLGFLHERRKDSNQPLLPRKKDAVEDELTQMFTRLAIQAKSYDMAFHFPEPYVIRLSPEASNDPTSPTSTCSPSDAASTASIEANLPEVFSSSQEARAALDSICERVMLFNELLSSIHQGPNRILPKSVQFQGAGFRKQYAQWGVAFEPLLGSRRRPGTSNTERAGINVLKMMHIMSTILFLMGYSKDEMDFDKFTPQFKEIVELAKEVVVDEELSLAQSRCGDIGTCRHMNGNHNGFGLAHIKASFTLDLGIVPPLFVVGTKCRNRKLRREAISLLVSSPRREGMWDSLLCGKASQWIMDIEEECMPAWDGPHGMTALLVPDPSRRIMVKQILFDMKKREATLRCGMRGKMEGEPDDRAREAFVWW